MIIIKIIGLMMPCQNLQTKLFNPNRKEEEKNELYLVYLASSIPAPLLISYFIC
jgi:hypothetical protein